MLSATLFSSDFSQSSGSKVSTTLSRLLPLDVVKKTLENTTQLASLIVRYPMHCHFKARFKWANVHHIQETVSIDPIFSSVRSVFNGFLGAQVFYGCTSHNINVYGITSKSDFPSVYQDFICDHTAPSILCHDNAKEESSQQVQAIDLLIKDE